jgi:hypothetical protein
MEFKQWGMPPVYGQKSLRNSWPLAAFADLCNGSEDPQKQSSAKDLADILSTNVWSIVSNATLFF